MCRRLAYSQQGMFRKEEHAASTGAGQDHREARQAPASSQELSLTTWRYCQ
jgi:hypothetical protein